MDTFFTMKMSNYGGNLFWRMTAEQNPTANIPPGSWASTWFNFFFLLFSQTHISQQNESLARGPHGAGGVPGRGRKSRNEAKKIFCLSRQLGDWKFGEGVIGIFCRCSGSLRFTIDGDSCCQNVFIKMLKIWDGQFIKCISSQYASYTVVPHITTALYNDRFA